MRRIACKRWAHRSTPAHRMAWNPSRWPPPPRAPPRSATRSSAGWPDRAPVAAQLGRPQDMEWAFRGGRLHLLQSRPSRPWTVGAQGRAADLGQQQHRRELRRHHDPADLLLRAPRLRRGLPPVLPDAGRAARSSTDNAPVFVRMLGLIRGRVYYNLLNWYRVLAMLPGYALNRRFMEQMMGVRERPAGPRRVAAAVACQALAGSLRLGSTVLGLVANHLLLRSRAAAFTAGSRRAGRGCGLPSRRDPGRARLGLPRARAAAARPVGCADRQRFLRR